MRSKCKTVIPRVDGLFRSRLLRLTARLPDNQTGPTCQLGQLIRIQTVLANLRLTDRRLGP